MRTSKLVETHRLFEVPPFQNHQISLISQSGPDYDWPGSSAGPGRSQDSPETMEAT